MMICPASAGYGPGFIPPHYSGSKLGKHHVRVERRSRINPNAPPKSILRLDRCIVVMLIISRGLLFSLCGSTREEKEEKENFLPA